MRILRNRNRIVFLILLGIAGCWSISKMERTGPLVKTKTNKRQASVLLPGNEPNLNKQIDKDWNTGTLVGSIGLVAGTAIGGGFLGLPFYTAKLGFVKSSFLLVFTWMFMNVEAIVFIDLCLNSMRRNKLSNVSIYSVADEAIGKKAAKFLGVSFFFILNACLVAQLAKAGDILSTLLPFSSLLGSALTAVIIAGFVFLCKAQLVEKVNTFLTSSLLISFCMLVLKGVPLIEKTNLLTEPKGFANLSQCLLTFPVLLQLLKFHEIIPVVCNRLGGNVPKIKTAIILGSLLPLLMLLGWNTVALGLVSPGTVADPLKTLLQSDSVGYFVTSIAFTAMLTTIIGGYLALEQFFKDLWRKIETRAQSEFWRTLEITSPSEASTSPSNGSPQPSKRLHNLSGKIGSTARIRTLTVVPSLMLAALGPGVFYAAVEFAGAYPGIILFCISPPLMSLLNKKKFIQDQYWNTKVLQLLIVASIVPLLFTASHHLRGIVEFIVPS